MGGGIAAGLLAIAGSRQDLVADDDDRPYRDLAELPRLAGLLEGQAHGFEIIHARHANRPSGPGVTAVGLEAVGSEE